jgi:SH3-like domain-containing protein
VTASASPEAQARGGPVLELRVANTAGQGANLRAAPSRAADLIAILPDGAIVQAIGQESVVTEERWRHVRAPDGTVGWVVADLLAPAADSPD